MTKKYVIYVRRSSDEMSGKQIQSIPDQIWHCLEFAKKEGLEIEQKPKDFSDFENEADIFKEDTTNEITDRQLYQDTRHLFIVKESHSGKEPGKRKKRNKIVQMIKSGKIQGLISYSPDRQARNMLEGGEIIELADKDKVELKYKTFHFENNASGRMMLGFWFVFSKQYSDKLSEDIGRGNAKTVNAGKSLGDRKYGYIRDENGYYKPDGETFEYVQQAFYMKIYEQKSDLYIANWLNEHGVTRKTKKGLKKKVSNKMLGGRWRSEFYYGMYIRGGNAKDLREQEGFMPMITEQEFQKLENQLGILKRNTIREVKDKYEPIIPFTVGMVVSEDGYSFSVYLANPARFEKALKELQKTEKNATLANVVRTYQIRCRCSPSQSKYQGLEITYDKIEQVIIEKLKKIEISEEAYMHYLKKARIKISKIIEKNKNKIQSITLRINRLKSEKDEYIRRNMGIGRDVEEKRLYENERNRLNGMIAIATKEIEEINNNERDVEVEFDAFISILQKAPELFRKKSYKAKAILTDIFIDKIIITQNKEVILKLKPGIEKFFEHEKPLGEDTSTQSGSNVRGDNLVLNNPSNIEKGPDNQLKNKVISIFNTTVSYLVEMIGIEPMSERDRHDFLPL